MVLVFTVYVWNAISFFYKARQKPSEISIFGTFWQDFQFYCESKLYFETGIVCDIIVTSYMGSMYLFWLCMERGIP